MILVDIYGYKVPMELEYKVRKNFTLKELANTSGNKDLPMAIFNEQSDTFLDMLQEFRNAYAKPMKINSCYRQEEFNNKVGGDKNSAHLHMCAVDWGIKGLTTQERTKWRNKWADICSAHGVIGAINYYTNGFHLEAFSNKWYGNKNFKVRDYRGSQADW